MTESKQMNFQIRPETRERIREIARMTYRGYGDTLDWLVAEAWERLMEDETKRLKTNQPTKDVEE